MTTARQRAANRCNAARSTGPRSGAGRRRSAANAYRHGLEARVAEGEVAAAVDTILARLGRCAGRLSDAEMNAAEALARAELCRARVREAEYAHLVALEIDELPAPETRAATDRRIEAILDSFRTDGIAAHLLKGLGGAAQREAEALGEILRYRSRAETAWRQALRQWASASRQQGVSSAVGVDA